jgi:hypothetical protein
MNHWQGHGTPSRASPRIGLHDFIREPTAPEQTGHGSHGTVDMAEEGLVSLAQVVQAELAVRRFGEPIARALSVTGKQHLALTTLLRQRFELVPAELTLLRRCDELWQRRFTNVAQASIPPCSDN